MALPANNYALFEDWLMPLIYKMHEEQKTKGEIYSPSKIIRRFGQEINNKESVLYWCYKNDIPVFCPAITDGAIGDMMYTYSFKQTGFIVDLN